jgi:hypothetical protein
VDESATGSVYLFVGLERTETVPPVGVGVHVATTVNL